MAVEAYRAVISLHNSGYQLKVLEGDQVAIKPAVKAEHAEMIMAIREEPQEACRAIQCLPHLCMVIMHSPEVLRDYAADLFGILKQNGYINLIKIRHCLRTGETAWIYEPIHKKGYEAMQDIIEYGWGEYFECKEEGKRWGT